MTVTTSGYLITHAPVYTVDTVTPVFVEDRAAEKQLTMLNRVLQSFILFASKIRISLQISLF